MEEAPVVTLHQKFTFQFFLLRERNKNLREHLGDEGSSKKYDAFFLNC